MYGKKMERLDLIWCNVQQIFNGIPVKERHRYGVRLGIVKSYLDQIGVELAEDVALEQKVNGIIEEQEKTPAKPKHHAKKKNT